MSNALTQALDGAKADYKFVVRDLAQGKKVDMDKATDLAISVGRGLVGLQEDVEAIKPVIEAEKYIAVNGRDAKNKEIEGLIKTQHAANRKIQDLKLQLKTETERLQRELTDAEHEFRVAANAAWKAQENHTTNLSKSMRIIRDHEEASK